MFETNPFAELSAHISPEVMQIYVILMVVAVILGTILDMLHKKSAEYFFENAEKAKTQAIEERRRMGRRNSPGLYQNDGVWIIDKVVGRKRIHERIGKTTLEEAERYPAHVTQQCRDAQRFGERPERTFEQAAIKFVEENQQNVALPTT